MAFAAKFLRPFPRAFVFASSSSSTFFNSARFCCTKSESFKSFPTNFGSLLYNRVSNLRLAFSGAKEIYLRRSQFNEGNVILGASAVLGSISLSLNSLAMNDGCTVVFHEEEVVDISPYLSKLVEIFCNLALKMWLPVLFCWTVFTNFNLPALVVGKGILFLRITNPSPQSVYILVDKLRHSSTSQDLHLSNRQKVEKPLIPRKVEVEDYKLLCVAKVEMENEKLTIVGVVGGWWIWPPLSSEHDEFKALLDILTFLKIYICYRLIKLTT